MQIYIYFSSGKRTDEEKYDGVGETQIENETNLIVSFKWILFNIAY